MTLGKISGILSAGLVALVLTGCSIGDLGVNPSSQSRYDPFAAGLLSGLEMDGPSPVRWREGLANLMLATDGPVDGDARFLYPGADTTQTRIAFHTLGGGDLSASVTCDADATITRPHTAPLLLRAGTHRSILLPDGSRGETALVLGPEAPHCQVDWGAGHTIALIPEHEAVPRIAALDARADLCAAPDPAGLDPLEAAFHADTVLLQSCALPMSEVTFLPEAIDGLNARIEALTGHRVSREALMEGNPDMPLDFSDAPDLDLIYVSYLHMRADYTGYITARLLAHHARRGAVVRILLTRTLMPEMDRNFYSGLSALYPNIQVQYYHWDRPGVGSVPDVLHRYLRSHHMKVFLALSRTPGNSRVIVGGRNMHDGFVFQDPFDFSDRPYLHTYSVDQFQDFGFYSVYEDFEIELRDETVVETIAAQLGTFWQRDAITQVTRPMAVRGDQVGGPTHRGMRHFLSVPYNDGLAQEDWYISLIDAAQHQIYGVMPFIYAMPRIEAALVRAHNRGVRVRLVARIESTDPTGWVISGLNRSFAERYADVFEITEYRPETAMVHTKLLLIDGRLSVVASTNFTRRSFQHDTENGFVFLDPEITARLTRIVERYEAQGNRIETGELNLRPWDNLMLRMDWFNQYF